MPNPEGLDADDVFFQIVNASGNVIDSFKDWEAADKDLPQEVRDAWYKKMNDLYLNARRTALGVEQALDKLIAELSRP